MATFKRIVVLTGAGISAESGIPTFRASDGLWEGHKVEDVATPEAFARDPDTVHQFYNQRRQFLLNGIEPNPAHDALATFAKEYPGELFLVTQNIDNLHQRAGSPSVYPMHGELLKVRCTATGKLFASHTDIDTQSTCSCCQSEGNLRPHVVWFGEMPLYMETIERALNECDLFIAIGTSGNVYPAAGFVQIAHYNGAKTVEMNLEASASSLFDEVIIGPASQTVPDYLQQILKQHL